MTQPELLPGEDLSQQVRRQLHVLVDDVKAKHREKTLLAHAVDHGRMQLAGLFSLMHREKFYVVWGYATFRECVRKEFGFSARSAQLMVKVHRTLVERFHLPVERIQKLGWTKAGLICKYLTDDNLDAVLNDVEHLSFRELRCKYPTAKPALKVVALHAPVASVATAAEAPLAAFWRTPPAAHDFFVLPDAWCQLCFSLQHGLSVLLLGHAGCGKTELCKRAAGAFGRELVRINFGDMSEPHSTLIGNTHLNREKGTFFQESRLVKALRKPNSVILLDEFNRAKAEALNILLPVLDGQRYLALDDSADPTVVPVAAGVTFLATGNVGAMYSGAGSLDAALLDRFQAVVHMDFPPVDHEAGILLARCPGVSAGQAQGLARFACRQRELAADGEFSTWVSTRSLLAASCQLAAGVSMRDAVNFCVVNRFPAEGSEVSERAKLMQLAQLMLEDNLA